MDNDTLKQFQEIIRILRKRIYSIRMPQAVIMDLDSTLLEAYGKQEGRTFNFHYQSNGYHPLVCYAGMTGDHQLVATPSPIKNGAELTITGKDMDLITGIASVSYTHLSVAEPTRGKIYYVLS